MTFIKLSEEIKRATKRGLIEYADYLSIDIKGKSKLCLRSNIFSFLSDYSTLTEKTYQLHIDIIREA